MSLADYNAQGRRWHTVSPDEAPVLLYSRELPQEGTLHLSSLGGRWTYTDRQGERARKDTAFVRWGKAVLAWVKEHTPDEQVVNGFPYRATPPVTRAVAEGKLQLRI
jgi:hypothetical protein